MSVPSWCAEPLYGYQHLPSTVPCPSLLLFHTLLAGVFTLNGVQPGVEVGRGMGQAS